MRHTFDRYLALAHRAVLRPGARVESGAHAEELDAGIASLRRGGRNGHLAPLEGLPDMTPKAVQTLLYAILTQKQRERFETDLELDCSYTLPGKSRFRMNVFLQRDSVDVLADQEPVEDGCHAGRPWRPAGRLSHRTRPAGAPHQAKAAG